MSKLEETTAAQGVESKAAASILQTPRHIEVGDTTYEVARPKVATLIAASEYIAAMPTVKVKEVTNAITTGLAVASASAPLGDIIALLILGAKEARKPAGHLSRLRRWLGMKVETKREVMARKVLDDMEPAQMMEAYKTLLSNAQLSFFLSIIISLSEINILRPTTNATTASGQ